MSILFGDYRISLDQSEEGATLNFVSHAHSDHIGGVKKNRKVICSDITRDLVMARLGHAVNYIDPPEGIDLVNSGHMLGSKQLCVDLDSGERVVYTGDYQVQESAVAEKIEIPKSDVLIMDSTYPFPNVTFDERDEVVTSIQHYISSKSEVGCILFGAYSMGKGQEIVNICNDIGVVPAVDKSIAIINGVYVKYGINLQYTVSDFESKVDDGNFSNQVWIVSMNRMNFVRKLVAEAGKRIFTAVATGFSMTRKFDTDVQFSLSDHADFKQALYYIEESGPRRIYTRGGMAETFAKNLRAEGYRASPLLGKQSVLDAAVNHP